jgi:hypothetical protein
MDSPRVALIRRFFELIEQDDTVRATEELLAHSAEDAVFEPHVAHGRVLRSHEEFRQFWAALAAGNVEVRAGAYSVQEEGDSVIVEGWVRTIDEGRLADTQTRWVYRFNADDELVSARVER